MVVVMFAVSRRDAAVPAADHVTECRQTQLRGDVTQRHLLVSPRGQRAQCRSVVITRPAFTRPRLAGHLHYYTPHNHLSQPPTTNTDLTAAASKLSFRAPDSTTFQPRQLDQDLAPSDARARYNSNEICSISERQKIFVTGRNSIYEP